MIKLLKALKWRHLAIAAMTICLMFSVANFSHYSSKLTKQELEPPVVTTPLSTHESFQQAMRMHQGLEPLVPQVPRSRLRRERPVFKPEEAAGPAGPGGAGTSTPKSRGPATNFTVLGEATRSWVSVQDPYKKSAADIGIPVLPKFLRTVGDDHYSLGKVKAPCLVEANDREALKACVEKRAYKKELLMVVVSDNRADHSYHAVQSLRSAGYDHIILLGFSRRDCEYFIGHDPSLSCVYDDYEHKSEDFRKKASKWSLGGNFLAWTKRYKLMCRLSVMGYNVLLMDSDSAPLGDEYSYLLTEPMNRIHVTYQREYDVFPNGGYFRIQNASPRGPANHLLCFMTNLAFRYLDSPDDWMLGKDHDPVTGRIRTHSGVLMDQDLAQEAIASHAAGYFIPRRSADGGWWERTMGRQMSPEINDKRNRAFSPEHGRFQTTKYPLSDKVKQQLGTDQWDLSYHPIYFPVDVPFEFDVLPLNGSDGKPDGYPFGKNFKPGPLESEFMAMLKEDGLGPKGWDYSLNGTEYMAVGPIWTSSGFPEIGQQGIWDNNDYRYPPRAFHMHVVSCGWHPEDKTNVLMTTNNWQYSAQWACPKSIFSQVAFGKGKEKVKIVAMLPDVDYRNVHESYGEYLLRVYGSLRAISLRTRRAVALPWVQCDSSWVSQTKQSASREHLIEGRSGDCYHKHCRDENVYVALRPNGARCSMKISSMHMGLEPIFKQRGYGDYNVDQIASQFGQCASGARPFLFPMEFEHVLQLLGPDALPGVHNTLFHKQFNVDFSDLDAVQDLLRDRVLSYSPSAMPDYQTHWKTRKMTAISQEDLDAELARTASEGVVWLPGTVLGEALQVLEGLKTRGADHICSYMREW